MRPLPANDPAAVLLKPDSSGQLLGRSAVRGVACDRYALRKAAADWYVWIAAGPRPVPCRVSVVQRGAPSRWV